jgi:UDP-N-acetylglucosamine 2-epimerase (non-hydrolysing)
MHINKKRIHLVVAARPNFVKVAPVYHALTTVNKFELRIVHTGQHYDYALSRNLFEDLALPDPAINLRVGSGSHGHQVANALVRYEEYLLHDKPDLCIVPGDVNSSLACALAAAKLHVPVAHLEAGLRSFDPTMPEEINRQLTDRLSSILWTPSADADENLSNEGIDSNNITLVGNCMIDSLVKMLPTIQGKRTWKKYGLTPDKYCVVTLHRPGNVDIPSRLNSLMQALHDLAEDTRVIMPLHPRTRARLEAASLLPSIDADTRITLTEPLGYLDFLSLVERSRAVITDSGGIQEETTYLGIPCLTIRPNTERPVTCSIGTNVLVEPETLPHNFATALDQRGKKPSVPPLWDGHAGLRVAQDLQKRILRH